MSLFGELADDTPSKARSPALFNDTKSAANKAGNSLFADDLTGTQESPWALPTPKKAARSQLIKNLLPTSQVPDSYIDAYDNLLANAGTHKGDVGIDGIKQLLGETGLNSDVQSKILGIVVPSQDAGQGVGRNEFNVLLALVGLAQEGDEVTLDGVDERRKNLPQPHLPSLKRHAEPAPATPHPKRSEQPSTYATPAGQPANTQSSSKKNGMQRKQSFGLDADPWASPELHRNHNHASNDNSTPKVNGVSSSRITAPQRTTSAFTTTSNAPTDSDAPSRGNQQSPGGGYSAGWGEYNGSSANSFRDSGLGGGFGQNPSSSGDGNQDPTGLGAPLAASRLANRGSDETISITTISEMEGTMFFQHRNYQVISARRNAKVIRRYGDFVWLLDCLHKRYPFRQLPLLPPKRVAINGNHLAADASFVEKRRRGLVRFANALVRHPLLSQEQLVVMFLTVPTELAVWRKQATISVQDEFYGKALPPNLEDSLEPNLPELFDRVRTGVKRSAEIYINMCNQVERIAKRKEGLASEYQRASTALAYLTEVTADTYAADASDVPPLNAGLAGTAKHLNAAQSLLQDESRAWDEGVLEDLKKQRDVLVSMRDLFDRRERLDRDEIPRLEKRIKANEEKLRSLRARPEGVGKPGDIEKAEEAIFKDKEAIVAAHARHVFIKEAVRDEILFFQQTQYGVARLHQDWAAERVKYAELLAENWRAAAEEVEGMPTGE